MLTLQELLNRRSEVIFVHYASSDFRKAPVRVACISVFESLKNKTITFSPCSYNDEKSLLENFANYANTRSSRIFVGWNIKGIAYGPQVLERRFKELTGKEMNLNLDNWIDFDDVLEGRFGPQYSSNPKFNNLCKLNNFTCQDLRTGQDEIELFEKGKFREIELSVNRKVILLNDIYQAVRDSKLKTERPDVVFIVHGHDEVARKDLKQFITDEFGIPTIVLFEKPDETLTIVEKLEKYADQATLAIILLTPDDKTINDSDPPEIKRRARQNVILEMGYFFGKLGRRQVILLYKGDVEIPSDIYGILYKKFEKIDDIRLELYKEIKIRLED